MLSFLNVAQWISSSFPYIQVILLILIAISAITLIVAIMAQPSNPDGGNNAITGISGSYYMKNKWSTKEGRLQKLIIISISVLLFCTIAYFITMGIFPGIEA